MKFWYRSDDAASLDRQLEGNGVSADLLMENVGLGVAQDIGLRFAPGHCVICCGSGSNGGDGFVVARHLCLARWTVEVLLSFPEERSHDVAGRALKLLKLNGLRLRQSSDESDESLQHLLQQADVIVDALLGTGASGAPRGEVARLINAINNSPRPVWSIDMPSGVEGGTSCCVTAERTAMAAVAKVPLATGYGALRSGESFTLPLGFDIKPYLPPPTLLEMEPADAVALLPQRRKDDHKGSRGGVLIIGGSECYHGAPWLAVRGALRGGAGLVVLAAPDEVLKSGCALPEAIMEPLDDPMQITGILRRWENRCSTLLIGPGLGRDHRAKLLCQSLTEGQWKGSSLWDGDGLFWLKQAKPSIALMGLLPHEGEAAYLMNCNAEEIRAKRIESAKNIASQWGPVLLKGWRSIMALPGKIPVMVPRGNRGLAVPGSGDVLAGLCAALMAAGLDTGEALLLGCWLHGSAGEALTLDKGCDGLLASEIADHIPYCMKELVSQ